MSEAVDFAARAATIVAHDERQYGDAVVPPIFQTSLFTFSSYDEMAATFSGDHSSQGNSPARATSAVCAAVLEPGHATTMPATARLAANMAAYQPFVCRMKCQ